MCLYSNTKDYKVAKEPITVYKYVAKKYDILNGVHKGKRLDIDLLRTMTLGEKPVKTKPVFVSPYYPSANVTYLAGETIHDDNFQTQAKEEYHRLLDRMEYAVSHGLHTSKYSKDANYRAKQFVSVDYETAVLRCTIPAGARYFEGEDDYCSDTLVVEEVMAEYVSPYI